MIDPVLLSSITASITRLGTEFGSEYFKGIGEEAGKTSWRAIKALLGCSSDPKPEEIVAKTKEALERSPDLIEKLLPLLAGSRGTQVSVQVETVNVGHGGISVIAGSIGTVIPK
jgi:hypothetical protein